MLSILSLLIILHTMSALSSFFKKPLQKVSVEHIDLLSDSGSDTDMQYSKSNTIPKDILSSIITEKKTKAASKPPPPRDDDGGCSIVPSMVKKHLPKRPTFRGQLLIDTPRKIAMDADPENFLALQYNFLLEGELATYIEASCKVVRLGGRSLYNSLKPRRDIGYTVNGESIRYSHQYHPTVRYPPHTLPVLKKIKTYLDQTFPGHPYHELSDGLDILYSADFERGGSVGSHADSDKPWGIVAILSLGQTRWMRIRRRSDGTYTNVEMKHNSLLVMYGRTFQQLYTHQVDKLHESDVIYPRLSFNVRYLEGNDNFHLLQDTTSPASHQDIKPDIDDVTHSDDKKDTSDIVGTMPAKRQKTFHVSEFPSAVENELPVMETTNNSIEVIELIDD